MRLTFRVRYHTHFGQTLLLSGQHELLGEGDPARALPMQYLNEEFWQLAFEFPSATVPDVQLGYNYILRNPDGSLVYDWGRDKVINPAWFEAEAVLVLDAWNHAGFVENAFYTEPFQQILLRSNQGEVHVPEPPHATHAFKVKAPLLCRTQTLCLLGGSAGLGKWNTQRPILLSRSPGEPWLTVRLNLAHTDFPLEYKYGVFDLEQKLFLRYEDGPNRTLNEPPAPGQLTLINDGFARLPATTWKGAGVAIPVFSLRSRRSFGVGEFTDLKLLVDWCQQVGLKLIQVLPVNDTIAAHSWLDSYPYSAISAFALHPLYLDLAKVISPENAALLAELEPERRRLNNLPTVDYPAVVETKLSFLKQIYPAEHPAIFESREYKDFFHANRHWLKPYAVFCYLRDQYGTADFSQWSNHRACKPTEVAALAAEGTPAHREIAFHYFVQFHLHRQLCEAAEYAHSRGVLLKGDIPIGVYRHGVDAWQQPELYRMDAQAGAPPDAFAERGQNWSFPTYNWPRMQADGFAWWKRRFEQMAFYFDAFRIDHVLGFFRIWSIPLHAVEGIMGHFVPAVPVQFDEFARRGIAFNYDRFVRPYITDRVLAEIFGSAREEVKQRFLNVSERGGYCPAPEFATQRQVENFFSTEPDDGHNRQLKLGLYELLSNVILFEDEPGRGERFHFRFGIDKTTSFNHLDSGTRASLWELYLDYFFRRQEEFWRCEGKQKLAPLKRATDMLVCGEDLGMVPACVPQVMGELGLLGLEVQRMPKALGHQFSRPANAAYLSVVTPSTHDMSTIRGWWLEDRAVTQRFYNQELNLPGEAPAECEPWLNEAIVRQHLASPAMWSIFQLQDLLGMDDCLRRPDPAEERINVPANPRNLWRYRMHLTLEQLAAAADFNRRLKTLLEESGRA